MTKFLVGLRSTPVMHEAGRAAVTGIGLEDMDSVIRRMDVDQGVPPSGRFKGGTSEAGRVLRRFIKELLDGYSQHRNRPETDYVSYMGMYLHFGQISPVYLALEIMKAGDKPVSDREDFLEELVVRRELACNFVNFTPDYDRMGCLPRWALATLKEHANDPREYIYSSRQLDAARTHDPYWNAAMLEMKHTGYMHNYMRMYWGKKILEWSPSPEAAWRRAIRLNNKYFIDGRDPNSYAGVAWVFGMHDRAWSERDVYGKIRYMSAGGLERKADAKAYVEKVERMIRR
jgi:deoxyribodipyrimidine photo-lyase